MIGNDKNNNVPVWKKLTITPKEASDYTNIGINAIYDMLKDDCEFLLNIGNKKLIKRELFEQYIMKQNKL